MRILGVELHVPCESELTWLPQCAALGTIAGLVLLGITQGDPAVLLAEQACALTAGFLAAAGANLNAGWRGVAICLMCGLCSYGVVLGLL